MNSQPMMLKSALVIANPVETWANRIAVPAHWRPQLGAGDVFALLPNDDGRTFQPLDYISA